MICNVKIAVKLHYVCQGTYSSPVMLISRKLTKDKRVVTDFRHLILKIFKNNLAYPLLKDTFSVLEALNVKHCQY